MTTLHSFSVGAFDGAYPYSPPILGKKGIFYGVTSNGGGGYSITSTGTYKLLTTSIPTNGYAPLILASDGNFYGTSESGGSIGAGTVFRMSTTGAVKIIYNFDGTRGSFPYGPVVQGSDGFLYGTASTGGSNGNTSGLVFKLSTAGAITVLHEFDKTSTTDGYSPISGLVAGTDGNFYGATTYGTSVGNGTLFKMTKSGTYSVLHVFDGTHGGQQVATSMQHTDGVLYGLPQGGSTNSGAFYSLAEGISPFISLIGYPSAIAGSTVEILGNGLTGTTSVLFGSGSGSFTVVSDTYMTAIVPASGTTGTITVNTPSGALNSKQTFKVTPVLSSFSPTSGPVGSQVTIKGTGLNGASKVTFGGVNATVFTVNSSGMQVTVTVPTGAVTGTVKITTAGGIATGPGTFTVN